MHHKTRRRRFAHRDWWRRKKGERIDCRKKEEVFLAHFTFSFVQKTFSFWSNFRILFNIFLVDQRRRRDIFGTNFFIFQFTFYFDIFSSWCHKNFSAKHFQAPKCEISCGESLAMMSWTRKPSFFCFLSLISTFSSHFSLSWKVETEKCKLKTKLCTTESIENK